MSKEPVDDVRPEWTYITPEPLARWLCTNTIKSITSGTTITGVDSSEEWLEFTSLGGQKRRAPKDIFDNGEFIFTPSFRSMVKPNPYVGVKARIDKIDAWDMANADDWAEYERLKKKFGGK